jgi:hypothetical protein
MSYGACPTWSAQFVTAGDAKDEPLPAMPAAVMNDRSAGAAGGVADAVGDVVDVVDVVDVEVEVVVLPDDPDPAAASAPAGVPTRTSASTDVIPTSAGALHRRRRAFCSERLWRMDVLGNFTVSTP